MKIKFTPSITAICILISGSAFARGLSPQEALDRVLEAPTAHGMKKAPARNTAALAHTFNADGGAPMLYVFNNSAAGGYIIASADDAFPALLGYGDNGNFKSDSIPASMKWFLDEMALEMEYALNNKDTDHQAYAVAPDNRRPIAPLLKSRWDQEAPYNLYSPPLELTATDGTPTGETMPTVTGCVATSMAQVMYYHKWPDVGVGSNKYEWQPYSNVVGKTLSCDFSKYAFDWDNMLDTYGYNADGTPAWTDAQAKAVADLMYACGISVNMTYNSPYQGGSGAVSRDQDAALINNFKYSRGMRYKYRDFCSSAEFEDIIYDNLSQGLPVLYNGRSSEGGHSFVCDGYAGDHYFHFNWGWSGMSDGYFYLARLNPSDTGAGGSSGGFNSSQGITYNIRPVRDGIDTGEPELPYFNCVGNFDFDARTEQTAANGQKLTYTTFKVTDPINNYNAGFWNMSAGVFTGYIGVAVANVDGSQPAFVPGVEASALETNKGLQKIPAYLEEFPQGVYRISPAYYNTVDEDMDYIPVANGCRSFVTMTVDAEGNRTFENEDFSKEADTAPDLMVNCFNYSGEIATNTPTDFTIAVTNNTAETDYYGGLTMVLKNASGKVLTTKPLGSYNVPAGMTIPSSFSLTLDVLKRAYKVGFRDRYGRDLPGEFDLNITKTGTTLNTQLRLMLFTPTAVEPGATVPTTTLQIGNYGSSAVTAPVFSIVLQKTGSSNTYGWSNISFPSLTMEGGKIYPLAIGNLRFMLSNGEPIPAGEYELKVYWEKPTADGTSTERTLISLPIPFRIGYPVEAVTFDKHEQEVDKGAKIRLEAEIAPANATFRALTWVSNNPAVATVDNDGNVEAVSEGQAYISAAAYNGIVATSLVRVMDRSGIGSASVDADAVEAVYTTTGIKILSNPSDTELNSLPSGIYIYKTSNGAIKVAK